MDDYFVMIATIIASEKIYGSALEGQRSTAILSSRDTSFKNFASTESVSTMWVYLTIFNKNAPQLSRLLSFIMRFSNIYLFSFGNFTFSYSETHQNNPRLAKKIPRPAKNIPRLTNASISNSLFRLFNNNTLYNIQPIYFSDN